MTQQDDAQLEYFSFSSTGLFMVKYDKPDKKKGICLWMRK